MKIRPGEALRNEIILQGNCQTHLFLLQEAQCKLFQALFWLGKKSPRKGKLIICTRQKKVISVLHWHYRPIFLEISEHDHYG